MKQQMANSEFESNLSKLQANVVFSKTMELIMNRLLMNYVMSFSSLDGRSYGKLPFRSNPLCQVVIG